MNPTPPVRLDKRQARRLRRRLARGDYRAWSKLGFDPGAGSYQLSIVLAEAVITDIADRLRAILVDGEQR